MPATMTHRFYDYTLRPAVESDFLLAEEWTSTDPWHREASNPLFWLDQGPQSESYLLIDSLGPVFFFKMMRTTEPHVIELHIQFPSPDHSKNIRMMLALMIGLEWLKSALIPSGITTVFFESQSPRLINFCVRRLGFVIHGKWLVKTIIRGIGDVRTYGNAAATATGAS